MSLTSNRTPKRPALSEPAAPGFQMTQIAAGPDGLAADYTSTDQRQYLYFHRGRGGVELDHGPLTLKPGSIVEAPASGLFKATFSANSRAVLLGYSDAFIWSKLIPVMEPPPGHTWRAYHRPRVFEFFTGPQMRRSRDEIMRELCAAEARLGRVADAVVAGYIFVILFQPIFDAAVAAPTNKVVTGKPVRELDLALEFRGLVEINFSHHLTVREYCQALGVAYTTLSEACRSVLSMTPLEYINEKLILEAKRLLQYSERPVDTISYDLGFNYPSYFTRFFKRHVGCAPRQFRRSPGPL